MKSTRIEILTIAGCPNTHFTHMRVREALVLEACRAYSSTSVADTQAAALFGLPVGSGKLPRHRACRSDSGRLRACMSDISRGLAPRRVSVTDAHSRRHTRKHLRACRAAAGCSGRSPSAAAGSRPTVAISHEGVSLSVNFGGVPPVTSHHDPSLG